MPAKSAPTRVGLMERFASAESGWLVTVLADGRPHTVPIWFVWHREAPYIFSRTNTVHLRNMQRDPRVILHLPETHEVLMLDGIASIVNEETDALAPGFREKYSMDLYGEAAQYTVALVRVEPVRITTWGQQGSRRWVRADGAWEEKSSYKPY